MRAALIFLTRIPVGGFPYSREDWTWAPAHFPFAGLIVGTLGAALFYLTLPLGPLVAAAITVTFTVWVTGAFHEDGLADTFDALGGSHGTDRVLEILKDSRVGAFGAFAAVLSVVLRVALLAELAALAVPLLVVAHTMARTGPVWLMVRLPYVSGSVAKGASVAQGGSASRGAIATVWAALACGGALGFGVTPVSIGCAIVGAILATAATGWWFKQRMGGVTGDFLGATEQFSEAAILIGALAGLRSGL